MTESKPLRDSPLELLRHRIAKVRLDAHPEPARDAAFELTASIDVARHETNPRQWRVTLDVAFGPQDPTCPTPYDGAITFVGEFNVRTQCPDAEVQKLVEVTGVSMLYGACREAIANLTARATHGMITLPSVSFFEPSRKNENKPTSERTASVTKQKAGGP